MRKLALVSLVTICAMCVEHPTRRRLRTTIITPCMRTPNYHETPSHDHSSMAISKDIGVIVDARRCSLMKKKLDVQHGPSGQL
jgi:hypothetical protein